MPRIQEKEAMKTTIKLLSNPVTEHHHQVNVIRWSMLHRTEYPVLKLLHHVPNGGTRDTVEAARLKDAGVKPGVPDLCLPVARWGYHGMYIEMKKPDGKEEPEQKWWHDELTEQRYCVRTCYSWEDAVQLIMWYLSEKVYQ
jgi:hypothetical protein